MKTCAALAVGTAIAMGSFCVQAEVSRASRPVTPEAVEALEDVGVALRKLRDYSAEMKVSARAATGGGKYLDFDGTIHYVVSAPTQLAARIQGEDVQRQVYYDGTTITVHAPVERKYAQINAPGQISTFLDTLKSTSGIELPVVALLEWVTSAAPMSQVTTARYAGARRINGLECEHYSYVESGITWELWVAENDLPCKLVRVDTRDAGLPGYSAEITWNTEVPVANSTFQFTPEDGAVKVDINEIALRN